MIAAASSVIIESCSMLSMPASLEAMMPSVPCACAAILRPCRCASSAAAFSSSSEYCCAPAGPSNESTPAVAQILMTFAPCLTW